MTKNKETFEERKISVERKAYEEKMKAQIDELSARLEILRTKADQAKADAKIEIMERLDELQTKRKEVERNLKDLQAAGEDAWKDLRNSLDKAVQNLTQGIKQAFSNFG